MAATVAALWLAGAGPAWGAAQTGATVDLNALRAQQEAVVNLNHQVPIGEASFAVSGLQDRLAADRQALATADASASTAAGELAAAGAQLQRDQTGLEAATAAVQSDDARLISDRRALKGIAVALYTGQVTNPQPTGLHALASAQRTVIDTTEIETITALVGRNLQQDLDTYTADSRRQSGFSRAVAGDRQRLRSAQDQRESASSRSQAAQTAVATDTGRLAAAQAQLDRARQALASDLAAVAGPPTGAGGLSVVGGAALDAAEMVAWYRSQGYADLTPAPVEQLAAWYLQAGSQEGVRGDVAFAQAVLETGGFGSPDSVQLNNYAGIGHCDTCSAGWGFPSPQGGVLGQEQLLRIFADGNPPAGSPAPVLPSLRPADQGRRGCCSTWQALTGVWATDPTYGSQIMGIYQQMLSFALSNPSN